MDLSFFFFYLHVLEIFAHGVQRVLRLLAAAIIDKFRSIIEHINHGRDDVIAAVVETC